MNRTQTEAQQRYSKLCQLAACEVKSLLSEGYTLISQSNACEMATLRHRTNGNYMHVEVRHLGVYVFKNGKLIKIEPLA